MSLEPRPTHTRMRRLTRRQKLVGGIVVILIVAALALVVARSLGTETAPGPGGPGGGPGGPGGGPRSAASTVGVATASTADVPVILDAIGTVVPAATVTLRPQVSGVIAEVYFTEGQLVRKGQVLAQIDPRPFQAALTQAQGQLQQNQAQLTAARVTLARYETLLQQDSIATQEVDTQRALVQQLEGAVTAYRGAVQTAQLNLGFARIVAPASGRIGLRVIDAGNYIAAGDDSGLAVITTLSPIDVEFTVPQSQIGAIQQRAYSGARLPVLALDTTREKTLDAGVFSTLDNQISTTTGTVRGKARFPNSAGSLFPSQFVNVRMTLDTLRDAVVVPSTAVRQNEKTSFVWVVGADSTVSQRPVVTGVSTTTTVVITSGLKVGEKVITEGGDRLTEGGKVAVAGQARPQRQGAGQRPSQGR
ncbi:efflux RND transporter periplasmic adaptor subunit [Brevundimonas sp. SL130]|uniref:efflux RND transporter periplasmic adaptor subunit n=1 Tax=Brevundimonas sp. SL130 TaxID=2995143 RepID=UPI00226CE5D2|nr:efflux RND transporter periplasmic adaptor subunit [Brevundimonas sp. SL130]WAC59015.1 efflux RND transporter periplasmic adaptor subunit [Brevundimonas sp. SL130]